MIPGSRIALFTLAAMAAVTLSDAATAQNTFVVPPHLTSKPANSLDWMPLGWNRVRHCTYIDKGYLTGLASGAKIKELRFRREENRLDKVYSNREPMRRNSSIIPNWEIKMGNFDGDYANLNPQYENRANKVSLTTVFAAQLNYTTNTPTLFPPSSSSQAAPFAIRFPFNITQVTYGGTGLAVNHKVYTSRNVNSYYYVDTVESKPNNGGSVELISPSSLGCPKGFNRVYGTAPNPGAGSLKLHLFGAPANSAAICFFGASATTWNGANLPLSLAFMNMAGCNIYTGLSFPLGSSTDFSGIASVNIPIPANSAYAGAVIYNQWGVADKRVNPINGFALSDGVKVKIGPNVGADTVRMSVIAGTGNQANSSVGYVMPNRGPVMQFVY